MNENLNLVEILKNAPVGTKLYSTLHGECQLECVDTEPDVTYPINVSFGDGGAEDFQADGKLYEDFPGECVLFPSRDQRDWSKFQVPNQKKKVKVTLHPFDKVLKRDTTGQTWEPSLLRSIAKDKNIQYPYLLIDGYDWKYCIPYNRDTAHLLDTTDECPIDYDIDFDKSYKE